MNDEEFERSLQALELAAWKNTVQKLRARDTAQREALARVEAERDGWKEQRDILADYCRRADDRTRTAQAQLAEAVGLLRKKQEYLEAPYPYGAYSYGSDGTARTALAEVKAFLARRAQAEQQEAPLTLTSHAVGYCGGPGTCLECGPSQAQREAQGAQDGDEREAFESSLDPSLSRETFVDEEGDTVYRYPWVQGAWIGWSRRAALATQPAAGEPIQVEAVAVTRARKNGGLALEWLIEGGISALEAPGVVLLVAHGTVIDDQGSGEVYLAPPAAAHGDAAVRKDAEAAYIEMTCQPVLIDGATHYYLSSEKMQAFDRLFSVDVSDAAMRAQGDGE